MNRQELAQWHRDQAEILESGKPLERLAYNDRWVPADGDCRRMIYRLAPERKPIPDYDLTESEVTWLIDQGYTHIATDCDGDSYGYGLRRYDESFERTDYYCGVNRYTGEDWRESLRELKL